MWNPNIVRENFLANRDLTPKVTDKDVEVLRRLAERNYEISQSAVSAERRRLWKKHNSLESERPMILADPEAAWAELIPTESLLCEDPLLREWELIFRKGIFNFEKIGDDDVIEPWFDITWDVRVSDFGLPVVKHQTNSKGSYSWEKPIKNLNEDLEKLKFRKLSVNRENTYRDLELAEKIFKDILPVRIRGKHWWTVGMTIDVIHYVGLEEFMLYMYDDPEGVKRLMSWFSEETMHFIQWFEDENLLSDSNTNDYTGSGGLAYTDELPKRKGGDKVFLSDLWGLAESQETVGISPDMFGEFIFPYQLPLIEKFGLACYGCCEPIDQRFHYLSKIKNLRRLSVSAWANEEMSAEKIGKDYIYSRKPNPTPVVVGFDEKEIRKSIRQTLNIAKGCNLEFNMKDTHTLEFDTNRIGEWVKIVREETDSIWF